MGAVLFGLILATFLLEEQDAIRLRLAMGEYFGIAVSFLITAMTATQLYRRFFLKLG